MDTMEAVTKAVTDLADYDWSGPNGEKVSGEKVAHHLESAAEHMRIHHWDPQLHAPFSGHNLRDAMNRTAIDGHGTYDSKYVSSYVCGAYLSVLVGDPFVDYERWSEHPERTLVAVLDMLHTVAEMARQYGPKDGAL